MSARGAYRVHITDVSPIGQLLLGFISPLCWTYFPRTIISSYLIRNFCQDTFRQSSRRGLDNDKIDTEISTVLVLSSKIVWRLTEYKDKAGCIRTHCHLMGEGSCQTRMIVHESCNSRSCLTAKLHQLSSPELVQILMRVNKSFAACQLSCNSCSHLTSWWNSPLPLLNSQAHLWHWPAESS